MHWLVTAGATVTPIDRVRGVTDVVGGRAGAAVARTAWGRGHAVTLVTSQPDALAEYGISPHAPGERLAVVTYRTYDDLAVTLQRLLRPGGFDAVCHAAAVADFLPAGVYAPTPATVFHARTGAWEGRGGPPALAALTAGKVPATEPEVWVRLVRAPRLADRFRTPWGFAGVLVDFRVEDGVSDTELVGRAEAGRERPGADLVVATTVDGAAHWAFLGPRDGRYDRVNRRELPDRLVLAAEDLFQQRG